MWALALMAGSTAVFLRERVLRAPIPLATSYFSTSLRQFGEATRAAVGLERNADPPHPNLLVCFPGEDAGRAPPGRNRGDPAALPRRHL